jgi:nucleoside-diphosphate-sugar epimerase
MRIFVTGASGFVGSAVVRELLTAGHEVVGLARSDAAAKVVADAGAVVYRGDLEAPESLRRGVSEADAVVHTGFNHDFSRFKASCEHDRRVIEVLGAAMAGTSRRLVVTSAMGVLPHGVIGTEETLPASGAQTHPRAATEEATAEVTSRGVNVSVVRLPPSVHGDGDHAFVPMLIDIARRKGASAYVADGSNRWPAVHRLDAARLYRLVLENGRPGARYHAVAEEGLAFRDIAAAIGHGLNVPVVRIEPQEASAHFGWLASFVRMDVPATSARTREQLGWAPKELGLMADIGRGRYLAT